MIWPPGLEANLTLRFYVGARTRSSFGAEVGWSAFKLVVAPVCAFCAAAASR
jgi:hypothetical protein